MGISQLVEKLLPKMTGFERSQILSVLTLPGDGSARQYTRVTLTAAPVTSLIHMKLARGSGPVSSAGDSFSQDDTFVASSQFLNEQGIGVPKVFWDGRQEGFLLVEDVGEVALADLLLGKIGQPHHTLIRTLGRASLPTFFSEAISWIHKLQALPKADGFVGFQREIGAEHYYTESQRFVAHYLVPYGFDANIIGASESLLKDICDRVAQQKRTLIHRDFMAWNIHVDDSGELRVIDFQDMTLGSYVYDLVSLLHDRDSDWLLGRSLCEKLAEEFKVRLGLNDEFYRDYALVVLQRYFRLAGQFSLLTQQTGKPIYQSWVPGCLKRVGHFLPLFPEYNVIREQLTQVIPIMHLAGQSPWFEGV